MLNPMYVMARARRLMDEYEDDQAKAVATQALDLFEQALKGCTPTKEALERDQANV